MASFTAEQDRQAVDIVRGFAMDAPLKANSGHQGTAMALAPLAHVLYSRVMKHDPADPNWANRDRFVLSNGHASILQYSMLYLNGYGLEMDDIKEFRQWESRTPGHPEARHTPGIEVTTGPLGQGFANAVGMAIAERVVASRFGSEVIDHHTFVIAGDGCFMEGVSHEAASLAGHLALGKLICVYDDNHITIDGDTALTFSDDVPKRFEAYGWHVVQLGEAASLAAHLKLDNLCWMYDNNHITIDGDTALAYGDDVLSRFEGYGWNVVRVGDANDANLLERAFGEFKAETGRPTLIVIDSHIGWGSPNKQDTESAHGEPLGEEEVRLTKKAYGWPEDARFLVPDGVRERFAEGVGRRGAELRAAWARTLESYAAEQPELAAEIEAMQRRKLPDGWDAAIPSFEPDEEKGLATRKASNKVENAIAERVPWLIAGSADLTDSTSVRLTFDGAENFEP